jgi:hypothetical protein
VGASTDAARAEVLASRQLLLVEVGRLEAAGRSAVDIPSKFKKSPVKTAALIVATGFMVVGGPKRTYRAARRAIFGPTAELPKSMLPDQIEKALKALGEDGNVVRGVLEREFVDYLEKNKGVRDSRDLKGTVAALGGSVLGPVTSMAGKRLAQELFKPEGGSFGAVMDRIQSRRESRKEESGSSSAWTPVARLASHARRGRKAK